MPCPATAVDWNAILAAPRGVEGIATMTDTKPAIVLENVNKWFGALHVLRDVSLTVAQKEKVVICGPSGSGKSTLIRCINRLETHQQGKIIVDGTELTDDTRALDTIRREVGMVFQSFNLFPHLTILENCTLAPIWVRKMPKDEAEAIAMEFLTRVKIPEQAKKYPGQLSGGQRQRVALARARAVEPTVLQLDEPFGALDATVRKDLRRWLRRFHDEIHLTTVFVTHDQEEALEIADEVVIMNHARVEQVGSPQHVYDQPASPFVYQFLGNVNVLQGSGLVPPEGVEGRSGALDKNGRLYVRPHDIQVMPFDAALPGASAVIRHIHAAGPQARLSLEQSGTGDPIEVEISRSELLALNLQVGDSVHLRLRQAHSFEEDYAI